MFFVGKGSLFGELGLLYREPRAATVRAKKASEVWVIDRQAFKDILDKCNEDIAEEHYKKLGDVDIMKQLPKDQRKEVARALVEEHFHKADTIFKQGTSGDKFYILIAGEVDIVKDGAVVKHQAADPKAGTVAYFGELALIKNEVRAATVIVTSDLAKVLALKKDTFDLLLQKKVPDFLVAKNVSGGGYSTAGQIARNDLALIGRLGIGGYGAVGLWEHKPTGKTYALKELNKGHVVRTKAQKCVMNEKKILLMCDSPFIIKLYQTYNLPETLEFLLEPALGGELFSVYRNKFFHGSEKHAKYYCAGVVQAFEHLHERHVLYRDLKPENLLLNEFGHIKLTDMGLAKFTLTKTFTTCGTTEYFAPEVINHVGQTVSVDWWTLGILIFELMCGLPPVDARGVKPMDAYQGILEMADNVQYPGFFPQAAQALCDRLLKRDPAQRLPMLPGGLDNIRNHSWYKGFNWAEFNSAKMKPPYRPKVKGAKDIRNFDKTKKKPPVSTYVDDGSGWDKDF
eukprot:gnl/TRDRNA2_/TRDRNA2_171705_c0_seq2.p1 gnl/TRDRNA2_/TRDRNA2_171705_c0~~gnl/TRDRNA2_/TRDRNA2_171705_c0_seq2.p1  ORF type:complete len:512 (+),score=116.10 gnl/TRDRNA2_/TRDRNA2_171705_c0_seq2:54-1589(+)